jgi:hypothetical protein
MDYLKIAHALMVYKGFGYQYVEVPWIANPGICGITAPPGTNRINVEKIQLQPNDLPRIEHYGELIASGEQGFLQIASELKQDVNYVTATPCFRDEPNPDEYHLPWFFKVELFRKVSYPHQIEPLNNMIAHARRCMGTWAPNLEITQDFDLRLNGIEVGSYGIRSHDGLNWVFGTGLAEPRFTQALASRL